MPVGSVDNLTYNPDQVAAAYAKPASAPDTSSTQPPQHSNNNPQRLHNEPQQQKVQVYFYDANLGQNVNILV